MNTKKLKELVLDLAIHGKLVPQDPNDEPASVLLERIKAEKAKIAKGKKTATSEPIVDVPFEVPNGWVWCKFGDYLDVRDGTHDSPKYVESGIPFVTSKNLKNGKIDFSNVLYISRLDHEKFTQRSNVEDNDILFAMIGSIGNPVLIKKDREFSIKNVALFKAIDRKNTFMQYVLFFLIYVQDILKEDAKGGMQPFIPLSYFRKELYIPLPPLAEQQRIVAEIERWFGVIDALDSNEGDLLKSIEQTKKKVLDLAIHGKLVPQDSNDEPASVLLERIKAEKAKTAKGKKTVSSEPIDEVPFEVPNGWMWCSVEDIFEFNPKNVSEDNVTCGFIPMTLVADGFGYSHSFEKRLWGKSKKAIVTFRMEI